MVTQSPPEAPADNGPGDRDGAAPAHGAAPAPGAARDGASAEDDAAARLSALRRILLGADQRTLDELSQRIRERQRRADDVAEVLPEAFLREFERAPGRLTEAVRAPIERTLHEAVRRDPRPLADAIFPVIGPAIRHYVTASIRALAASLSRMIERGLSPQRQLTWRFQAWRAGVRFGDYVLQRTFVYRVEHVYLIQSGTGQLVAETHHDDTVVMDGDAVSAMLSALQSFVLDSFSLEEGERLDTAELGEFTLWAVHGPQAMLACAIRGVPGPELREELEATLESIHLRFAPFLERFQGEAAPPPALQETLERCLLLRRADDDPADRQRIGWPVAVMLIAALVLLGRWGALEIEQRRAAGRLAGMLNQTPGLVVTHVERRGATLTVRGLRDPLTPPVEALAARADVDAGRVVDATQPYLSLEHAMVLARLRARLEPPATVTLRLTDGVLAVSGSAGPAWVARLQDLAVSTPGVERVDTTGLRLDDAALRRAAEAALAPPAGVSLAVHDGELAIAGEADLAWLRAAAQRWREVAGLTGIDTSDLRVAELARAQAIIQRVQDAELFFIRGGDDYREASSARVAAVAQDLVALAALARRLERPLQIVLTGHADALGDDATNRRLRSARAARLRDDLIARGVPTDLLTTRAGQDHRVEDADLRKAQVAVRFDTSPYRLPSESPGAP